MRAHDNRHVRFVWLLLIVGALVVSGCGDDEASAPAPQQDVAGSVTATAGEENRAQTTTARRQGTRIAVGRSPFGTMLFDSRRQAIYIFQKDRKGASACYGECAKAWPPVYTKGAPVAASGVRRSLLGTVKRRDGRLQVSYAGRPLYYYAHEAPGEVRCHNVDLNGGLWWVVGPDGKRRP